VRAESVDAVVTVVGRERELAALSELLEAAERGRGSVAVLVGEPGIGKTATARELARRADGGGGVLVHWAACFENDPRPFASWVRIGSRIVECTEPDDLHRRLGAAAAAAAAVVPALADTLPGLAPPAPLVPAEARFRASDALARLVGAAGLRGTTLLVVDDLQWADSSSLEFLPHVARALRDEPVLLLGTARAPEVGLDHPLAHALAAAERELPVHRIPIAALDRTAIAGLIADSAGREASPEAVEAVLRETGGNAFFAHELVRHLVEEGYDLANREVPAEAVPAGVRDAVGGRIRRLSGDARSALAVACAFAGPFGFDELEAVTGLTEDSLLAVLDELLAASMLHALDDDRYEFGHSIVRHTLYEALTPSRRARLHRRVVEALETVEGGAANRAPELAEQYHRSRSLPGAANGVTYALAAAETARQSFAYESAARSLRIARDLAAEAPATVRADVLRRLALAEAEALRVDEARAAAEDALRELEAARASSDEIAAFLVEVAWALQEAGAEDVLVRPVVARGLALVGDDRGLAWARLKLAERPLERFVVAGVEGGRWTCFDARAVEIARSRGSERDWAKTVELMDWRSRDETEAVAGAALEWRDRGAAIHALSVVTRSFMHQHGAFREAAQSAANLLALSEGVGSFPGQAYAHVYLSWSALVRGDLDLARAEAARADDAVARLGRGHRLHFSLRFLRCALLESGDADWARAAELRMETVRQPAFPPWMTLLYLALATRAYAAAGDELSARRLLDEIVPVLARLPATTLNQNGAVAAAAWAAWLLRAREHAAALRRSALALIEAGVGDYPTTSRELAVAWMTRLAGNGAEGREYLQRARATLSAAGQAPLLELVECEQREGARGPDGLTGREMEVLRALAAGRSNKEIAAELVLSVHTVERHVANAYRKIGAHNRAEATAYAVTVGL